ncbi:Spx/MgsR family RNA polymerase-binding regulatory protein [uncultured Xylophilus sp.]|uniref:Spx/MgsR family RNA polymerase-binding regulatory protein n=1 Tax=uncultured Xylophilus sp. TaxID=296832 RepID=UPI0025E65D7C|nr:Spx/MgsR family RNA polymerase-binding regulatory protein [uncultured Xylophilus sp.]
MVTLYGIPHCDTVKKARAWLADRQVDVRFHDFKKSGVPASALPAWMAAVGRDRLLNRRGTTWRGLDAAAQAAAGTDAGAVALMQAQPSIVKRPVVEWPDGTVTVGFDADDWARRIA